MPRIKSAKHSAKHRKSNSTSSPSQKMEMDLMGTPAKIITYLSKECTTLNKKEKKLKAALSKIESQAKKSESRIKAAVKSSVAKRQLNALKKSHSEILSEQSDLQSELKEISLSLASSSNQHDKMVALSKHLSQFEKEWSKKAKKTKASKKTKARKATSSTMGVIVELPHLEPVTTTMENVIMDEPVEMAS